MAGEWPTLSLRDAGVSLLDYAGQGQKARGTGALIRDIVLKANGARKGQVSAPVPLLPPRMKMNSGKCSKPNGWGCLTPCVAKVGQRRQKGHGIPNLTRLDNIGKTRGCCEPRASPLVESSTTYSTRDLPVRPVRVEKVGRQKWRSWQDHILPQRFRRAGGGRYADGRQ